MKSLPSNLLNFLQNNKQSVRADLVTIALYGGYTIRTTSFQLDLVYGGNTYYSNLYGNWDRGDIEITVGVQSSKMSLTVNADPTVFLPGGVIPLLKAATNGMFDGALVTVQTAYGVGTNPSYRGVPFPDFSLGVETKFVGEITSINKMGRTVAEWDVQDLRYRLNQKFPRLIVQSACRHTLYDPNCTLNKASFGINYTAAGGSTNLTLVPSPANSNPADYFDQGTVTFTSGLNNGLSVTIAKQNGDGSLTLVVPTFLDVAVGDSFTAYPGCDKSISTCLNKFSNLPNFGGFPFVPIPETVL